MSVACPSARRRLVPRGPCRTGARRRTAASGAPHRPAGSRRGRLTGYRDAPRRRHTPAGSCAPHRPCPIRPYAAGARNRVRRRDPSRGAVRCGPRVGYYCHGPSRGGARRDPRHGYQRPGPRHGAVRRGPRAGNRRHDPYRREMRRDPPHGHRRRGPSHDGDRRGPHRGRHPRGPSHGADAVRRDSRPGTRHRGCRGSPGTNPGSRRNGCPRVGRCRRGGKAGPIPCRSRRGSNRMSLSGATMPGGRRRARGRSRGRTRVHDRGRLPIRTAAARGCPCGAGSRSRRQRRATACPGGRQKRRGLSPFRECRCPCAGVRHRRQCPDRRRRGHCRGRTRRP